MSNYDLVNVKMGTYNVRRFSNGNVLPLTAVPYGMASFTIQTEKAAGNWFYSPYAKSFEGVRLTHQPSPWLGDYGNIIICGQHGELKTHEDLRWSYYNPKDCVMQPAYMKSYINRDRYTFELSPTNSGAAVRFDFWYKNDNRINFIGDEKTVFSVDEKSGLVLGYTTACFHKPACGEIREYFAISLDAPFEVEQIENAVSLKIEGQKAVVKFATSFISQEQAILNYKKELENKSFDEVHQSAKAEWEKYLSRIEIEDNDEERKKTFYSCLYRVFLWPRRFYEIDEKGEIVHLNMHSGKVEKGYMYTDNGFWDTFRTVYPLLSVLDTNIYAEMAEGFYNYYKDSGWLPKWLCPDNFNCMPGMLIEATLSDAVVKEIVTGELAEKIFEAMLHDGECACEDAGVGREGLSAYRKFGYVPYTVARESVNETLDSCYGDFCIAQAAEKLGKKDIAERYYKYSKNYRNLFDANEGFMRGKDENGNFRDENYDSFAWGRDYTEGSAWQSSFAVHHDIVGLNQLYDGKLSVKIDELVAAPKFYSVGGYGFEIHEMSEMADANFGQCAISNQPSFHIPYIYSELGDINKTANLVKDLTTAFSATEEGYPGDEDNGTMSAWYVLSCLGFYQMCPSRADFTMSLPLFDKITVKLANGKQLIINKKEMDAKKMKNIVGYFDIMKGGNLKDIVKK